jgi:chemotaxis response regulator CheB
MKTAGRKVKEQETTVKSRAKKSTSPQKAGLPLAQIQAQGPPITESDFPIVGIGASAGGLEALEIFFHICRRKRTWLLLSSST